MFSYEEFQAFYEKNGRCVNDIQPRNNSLNSTQLKTRYKRYVESENKKAERAFEQYRKAIQKSQKVDVRDLKWEHLRYDILNRDRNECRYMQILSYDEYMELKIKGGSFTKQIDIAHVLSRGAYPQLKYEPENLVALNRYSHSMLDQNKHPIYGTPITYDRKMEIWVDILGREQYYMLTQVLESLEIPNPFER